MSCFLNFSQCVEMLARNGHIDTDMDCNPNGSCVLNLFGTFVLMLEASFEFG
jgi:hypothetical protein